MHAHMALFDISGRQVKTAISDSMRRQRKDQDNNTLIGNYL